RVFYPEATPSRCTAALLVEVDPVGLVRSQRRDSGGGLDQYVNDRPYAASSFLSVAIASVFGTALSGRSRERPDLAATPLPRQADGDPEIVHLEPLEMPASMVDPDEAAGFLALAEEATVSGDAEVSETAATNTAAAVVPEAGPAQDFPPPVTPDTEPEKGLPL